MKEFQELNFPDDIKALLASFKKDEELGATYIVQPIVSSDEDDDKESLDTCTDIHEENAVIPPLCPPIALKIDYEGISENWNFSYKNYKKLRKLFPENNRMPGFDICKRYKSGVPTAPRKKAKLVDGLTMQKFEDIIQFFFKVTDTQLELIKC